MGSDSFSFDTLVHIEVRVLITREQKMACHEGEKNKKLCTFKILLLFDSKFLGAFSSIRKEYIAELHRTTCQLYLFFGMRSCKACNFGSDNKIIRGKVIQWSEGHTYLIKVYEIADYLPYNKNWWPHHEYQIDAI